MSEVFIGKLSYVIAAIYEVLLIYMYLKDFLGTKVQKWEKSLAFVFFFIFSTFLNMYVPIPFITLLYDFIGIFALSFFFDGDFKTKLFASVLFIAFLIVSEIMTLLSIMMLGEMSADTALGVATNRLLGVIISKTLLLVIVKIACAVRKKSYVKIPLLYWLALIFISIISILSVHNITVINMQFGYTKYTTLFLFIVIGLCFTNVLVFYLFESILRKKELEINNKLLEQQIEYQVNHYEELQVSQNELRVFRHDVKNHIFVITELLEEKNYDEALTYIRQLSKTTERIEKEVFTGNPVIDSLVTAKCSIAKSRDITVTQTIALPPKIKIDPVDACVILGNALDNAIEACCRIEDTDKRTMRIVLGYHDDKFICEIENSTDGKLKKHGEFFQTSKDGEKHHGLGLQNIDNCVKKYHGILNIEHDNEKCTFRLSAVLMCNE